MSQNSNTQAGKIQLASALLGERDSEGEAVWGEEGSSELGISAACRSVEIQWICEWIENEKQEMTMSLKKMIWGVACI